MAPFVEDFNGLYYFVRHMIKNYVIEGWKSNKSMRGPNIYSPL